MRLSMKDHAAAADYVKAHGRPLEAALYAYEFEGGSGDLAIFALSAFQNPDGGFGSGLESDLRVASSSVIATSIAFRYFSALGLSAEHPMVAAACAYLNTQYLASEKRWRIMPENVDDAPHAPWWQVGGELWNSRVNPTAELLGVLYAYPQHFSAAMRDELTEQLADYLNAHDDVMEMHDLLCYAALVENPAVPEAVKLKFLPKLKRVADKTVERSPEKWADYTIPPLAVVSKPDSPLARLFEHELPENLDFLIESRGEDGAWHPQWQWGDDAELWQQVEREIAGMLTLNNLKTLRAFGLIAGVK